MQAQTAPHYLGLTYYQTLPGKADEFRKFAETDLVKMGQAGVDEGVIDAYYMLRLTAPYNVGSDYNYLQAVWYKGRPSLAPLDMKVWEARAKKAGFSSYQQYIDKRDSLAKVVRSAWRVSMARIGDMKAGNYMRTATYQVEPDYRQEMAKFLHSDAPERRLRASDIEVGRFYRPIKQLVSLRVDADVLHWFRGRGKKYQTYMNEVLRREMQTNGRDQ
jgi:uncharacterized protein (DUF4415 family)